MQTDEYEISISREIKICREFIGKLSTKLSGFEEKYGAQTTDALFKSPPVNIQGDDLKKWQQAYEALRDWQQRLTDYQQAYESFRTKS